MGKVNGLGLFTCIQKACSHTVKWGWKMPIRKGIILCATTVHAALVRIVPQCSIYVQSAAAAADAGKIHCSLYAELI